MKSLANALIRDATSRYFRWKRGKSLTRNSKIPLTELVGPFKLSEIKPEYLRDVQRCYQCGCVAATCRVEQYARALIGGKSFNSGEKIRVGGRCGSVVTMTRGGRSVYGLIKSFYRVRCGCYSVVDFVSMTFLPLPTYPDSDPLTCKIDLTGVDVNNLPQVNLIPLYDIHPSRIAFELDVLGNSMYILRIDGYDII